MGRPILYPEAEELIKQKKILKLPQSPKTSTFNQAIHTKIKRKQSLTEISEKKKAKKQLLPPEYDSQNQGVCSSCKQPGHKRASSKACPNNKPNITDILKSRLGEQNERFVVSVPLASFTNDTYVASLKEGISIICEFQREVLLKAMLFVNSYILSTGQVKKEIFKQNFWYSVCRVICGQETISGISNQWPNVPNLQLVYTTFVQQHPSFVMESPPQPTMQIVCHSLA